MPRTYPVAEAKARLSEILRQVKRGRSVTISERGREIARVVPIERAADLPARLEELARDGDLLRRKPAGRIRPLARRPGALRRFLRERD
jgi:prevent-host-death family protein